jgi:DNA-binding transcriptional LysR family regulator
MAGRLERFAHNLDWNLLRTFVVLVEEGSITAAANRLLLQQPAVSMALKRLEQTTGHRLIDRRPGRFEVTEAGERLHRQAREIFAAVVRLPDVLESAGTDVSGHVSVHAVSHVHHPSWDERLSSFFAKHPKVTMNVTIETTADVITSVERGIATVGLCDGIIPPGLDKLPYKQERYALYCGPGHRLFGVEGADLNALRGDPYVAFTADVLGGQHMNAVTAVRAMGSFGHEVRAVSSHVEEVIRLVAANVGIGMLPHHLAAPLAEQGTLWQLPPYEVLPIAEVFRITNPTAILNPAETAFLAHMEGLETFDDLFHHQEN